MARRKRRSPILDRTMREVFMNEPSTVTRANVSPARKRKMKIAIAYSKARKRARQ